MNKSLYEISDELQQIIDNIEENGGEVDEFIEESLAIKQEELESKIEDYCYAITMINSDVECCKNEKQRINNIQNTKKNIVTKLKDRMLEAVLKWGEIGKTGNRVLNLPTHKLFTKSAEKIKVNEERVNTLSYYLQNYIRELKKEGILVTGPDIDLKGMMAAINAIIKANKGEDYPPFTVNDLAYVEVQITTKCSLANLFNGAHDASIHALTDFDNSVITEVDEDNLKLSLKTSREFNTEPTTTIGSIDKAYSLTIK